MVGAVLMAGTVLGALTPVAGCTTAAGPGPTVVHHSGSGYAAETVAGVRFRFVAADFNVPSVNCANSPPGSSGYATASHWVGLEDRKITIEQIGVDGRCDSSGTPTYVAWYQMWPLMAEYVPSTGVNPGDAIIAQVSFNASTSTYNLLLKDVTTGGLILINTNQKCPAGFTCRDNIAEVITEDPNGGVAGGVNLANFGMVNYTGVSVTSLDGTHGTLAAKSGRWTSTKITMTDPSGHTMASPSALYGGQAFNVTWRRAN
jgi:hypothetical protein